MRRLFRHKIDVERAGDITSDGGGGGTRAWSTLHEQEPCRIESRGGREALIFGKETVYSSHTIFIRYLTPEIKENDRIKYTQGNGTVRYFFVKWVMSHNELDKTMRLEVLEQGFS